MNRFPEAFERFEEKIDVSDYTDFKQLMIAFSLWGRENAPMSKKQVRALAVEAKEKDITPYIDYRRYRDIKTGKISKTPLKGTKEEIGFRDPITGRFMKRPEHLL